MKHLERRVFKPSRDTGLASKIGKMVLNTRDNGSTIRWKDRAKLYTQMKMSTKELSFKIKPTAKVNLSIRPKV